MPGAIDNGSTAKIPLYCVLSSDHISPATGKTVAVTISKNGAAFGNPSAGATNATEIGNGWYYFTPSATDTGTNGPLIVRGTNAATDDSTRDYLIAAAAPTAAAIAAAIWDEINTGATHNLTNSTGKQLRTLTTGGTAAIYSGTAPSQAGMTNVQIKLDSGASAVDNIYQYNIISILSGTGAGDSGVILSYVGSTKVATIDSPWAVQPDATSVFEITPGAKALVIDKTGFSMSAAGLDLIPVTDPGGVATTFPKMMVQLWRMYFKKSVKAVSGLTIKTYADDGTTVRTTQTYTDDGAGNQTRNSAT